MRCIESALHGRCGNGAPERESDGRSDGQSNGLQLFAVLHERQLRGGRFECGLDVTLKRGKNRAASNVQLDFHCAEMFFGFSTHLSRLTIMFKDSQFTPTRRYELYGNAEVIALFGGLLALFFGASVLSLVEVFYVFVWKRCLCPGTSQTALPHRIVAMDEFK